MDLQKSSPLELGQIYKQWKLVSNSFAKWLKTFYYYGYIPLIILLGELVLNSNRFQIVFVPLFVVDSTSGQTTVPPTQRGLTFWISIVFPFIGGDAGEAK
jgi:hypothetical protein